MSLLTPSESLAFNGFLSSIDFSNGNLPWEYITEKIPLPSSNGNLAKATKELMSLEGQSNSPEIEDNQNLRPQQNQHPTTSSWPNFPSEQPHDHSQQPRRERGYSYGFGVAEGRHGSRQQLYQSGEQTGGSSQSQSFQDSFHSRSQSPTSLRRQDPSSSPLDLLPGLGSNNVRPGAYSTTSAPATLNHLTSASSSKRSLPHDDGHLDSNAFMKRRRPSVQQPDFALPDENSLASSRSRPGRPSSSSSSTVRGPSQETESGPSRPALLSPSQKRANHIQSEQKRRANIRKGYETLCEVVPVLREAIQQEETARKAQEEKEKPKRRRKKTKAGDGEEGENQFDGRAGPRSENVVLQKTIDHVNALLAERDTLNARLIHARAVLPPGHPAFTISPGHLDERGVPLWEREWNGGVGWKDGDDDGDDD